MTSRERLEGLLTMGRELVAKDALAGVQLWLLVNQDDAAICLPMKVPAEDWLREANYRALARLAEREHIVHAALLAEVWIVCHERAPGEDEAAFEARARELPRPSQSDRRVEALWALELSRGDPTCQSAQQPFERDAEGRPVFSIAPTFAMDVAQGWATRLFTGWPPLPPKQSAAIDALADLLLAQANPMAGGRA